MHKILKISSILFTLSFFNFGLVSCGEISNITQEENDKNNNENQDNNNDKDDSNSNGENSNDNNDDSNGENTTQGTFENPIEVTIKEAQEIASKLEHDILSDSFYKCSGTVTQLVKQPDRTEFFLNKNGQNIKVYYLLNIDDFPRLQNNNEVTIVSQLKNFYGSKEFHRATITNVVYNSPEVVRKSLNEELFSDTSISYTSIAKAIEKASALPQDQESEGTIEKYWIKGFIKIEVTTSGVTRHFKLYDSIDGENNIFVNIDKSTYNALETKYEDNDEVILYGSLRHTQSPQIYHPEIKALKVHE